MVVAGRLPRDALIRNKIGGGQWQKHLGQSVSPFVNAASWGLLLTGKLVSTHSEATLGGALLRLVRRGGESLIRKGVQLAMQMLGEQFVTGQTIAQALERSRAMEALGFRYSYDMLGEAALTDEDALRYFAAYEDAIHAIGRSANERSVVDGPGISIKLSALHPRYTRSQRDRLMKELLPRVLALAELACLYDIGLNIDAEESERLDLSLDLLEALSLAPSLAGWNGIGFVVQAYQKRCLAVIDFIVDLARHSGRRLMVRLVKGAYWDSEIKRSQAEGLADYPVYTRKHHTDIAYLACAHRMLCAPEAIFPQFATHNAHTVASIICMAHELRGDFAHGQYEFQCLHGMGEGLYRQVVTPGEQARPCRIYAPVGTHETLLAYLVRRLLENGANSSFVHRIADPSVSIDELLQCPVQQALEEAEASGQAPGQPHPAIPLPSRLYGSARLNSQGLDLADEPTLARLSQQMSACMGPIAVAPLLANPVATPRSTGTGHEPVLLRNPADPADLIGTVRQACASEVEAALTNAAEQADAWARTAPAARAELLERAADLLQSDAAHCLALLIREAGKTWPHAVAELREAVDFLRYYAAQVRRDFDNATHPALGPVVCISPWNFPLAIFTGQVAAALAAGNTVLAKPAEQTPAIAAFAVQSLWKAGVPQSAVQLLPGAGAQVGQALVADARVQGVMFTGSTQTARLLQATLSRRLDARGQPVTFIAETGGQNCMVVDSSALLEQVAADAVASAFEAAGQRCSALRVLCVQEEVAARLIEMLRGAMAELRLDVPAHLHADVGPVIDERARAAIETHVDAMRARGRRVHRLAAGPAKGTWVVPTLIEIDRIDELQHEVFGPVLHVLRWRRDQLDSLLQDIEATGYALTLGVHSRIDETIETVVQHTSAGNVYVNRNMVGAVVGVQPFGGHGLSGTGPKAGGGALLAATGGSLSRGRRAAKLAVDGHCHAARRFGGPLSTARLGTV
jgi:RHH-type proline utilization regulon transcriptional repressor/proline dehydrogenase/delta 1-pyrroline-5-carboxylate dehydrogenase